MLSNPIGSTSHSKPPFVGEIKRIDECFPYIKNGLNIKQGRDKGGIPITRIETLSNYRFNRDKVGFADIYSTEGIKDRLLCDGDILMSHINSIPYIGRAVAYRAMDNDGPIIHGMNLLRLKADQNIILPLYAEAYFQSPKFKAQVLDITNKAVNQASFSINSIKALRIPVPSLNAQKSIIERLTTIKALQEQTETQLLKFDQLIKSRFVEMFGDPKTNSANEKVTKFINVVKMKRGFDLPVSNRVGTGTVPVYGSSGIVGYHDVAKVYEPGIVTGRSGTIGEVTVSNTSYWPLNTSLYSEETHGNNVTYLKYLLEEFDLSRFVRGAGVPTLNRNLFHSEMILDISLDRQQQFADFVAQVDKSRFVGIKH